MAREWCRGEYSISTDRSRLDVEFIHDALANRSYWARGRTIETIHRSLANSLNFGLYRGQKQIGLARVVTDFATFAWLCDVFIEEEHRGEGVGKWLMEVVALHPELQGLRRWMLATRDAHELYRRFGFAELAAPERWMERLEPPPIETKAFGE